jgi:hypothetical protein
VEQDQVKCSCKAKQKKKKEDWNLLPSKYIHSSLWPAKDWDFSTRIIRMGLNLLPQDSSNMEEVSRGRKKINWV